MKRSTVNILASYIDALHPIIYINHFDFKVIDDAIARVGKGVKCVEFNNALGIVDFYNKSPMKECDLEQFLKLTMDDGLRICLIWNSFNPLKDNAISSIASWSTTISISATKSFIMVRISLVVGNGISNTVI